MSEFTVVDGKIVELVEQEVEQEQIEAELETALTTAQEALDSQVNSLVAAQEALELAQANKDVAEANVIKAGDRRDAYAQALALLQEQTPDEEVAGSEPVDVPVTVAEPAAG